MRFDQISVWLPPFWLIGAGIFFGLAIAAVVYGIVFAVSRPAGQALRSMASEGAMPWLLSTLLAAAIVCVPTTLFVPDWQSILKSVLQLPTTGSESFELTIPAKTDEMTLDLPFSLARLQSLEWTTDRPATISIRREDASHVENIYPLAPGRPVTWQKSSQAKNPLHHADVHLAVSNTGDRPAAIRALAQRGVEHPQASAIAVSTAGVLVALALASLLYFAMPTLWTIAAAASREAMSQRTYWFAFALGVLLLKPIMLPIPSLMHLPYNTFGEDVKMLRDTGVTVVLVLGAALAIWSAASSIQDELESRTILALLAKPVKRWQFLVGKYLGIVAAAGAMMLFLGLMLMLTTSCKVVYDARETGGAGELNWQQCYGEMIKCAPALVLAFMEAAVLCSIAVALSTRLPVLANMVVSASVYALGHLVPTVVASAEGEFPVVTFMGQLIATVLPVLDNFKAPGAIVGGAEVPAAYLAWAGLYALVYSGLALLVAVASFERRDLA